MRNKWMLGLVLLAFLGVQVSFGDSFAESGDAGNLPGTAQNPTGSPLTSITGTIGSSTDANMYSLLLSGGGTPFSVTTCGTAGSLNDTQLFLFDSGGLGVLANDDACGLRSTVSSDLLPGGLYYLAISGYNVDPVSSGGAIFPNSPFGSLFGNPDFGGAGFGAGGGSAISGWGGSSGTGTYTIDLTGASEVSQLDGPAGAAAVPEPISLLLFGSGLAGIAGLRKKKG